MKSMSISDHFHSRPFRGCSNPVSLWCSALILLAYIIDSYIFCYLSLFIPVSPKSLLDILVYLLTVRVDGVDGLMCLLEYKLLDLPNVGDIDPFSIPQGSGIIFAESWGPSHYESTLLSRVSFHP
jgi:hypothetical protein